MQYAERDVVTFGKNRSQNTSHRNASTQVEAHP